MRRLAIAALALAACAPPPPTPTAPPPPLRTTTTFSGEVTFELAGCRTPPVAFSIICEAHDILTTQFRRPVEVQALVEAAVAGVEEYEAAEEGEQPEQVQSFVCAVPAEDYQRLCTTLAERLSNEPVPMEDLTEAVVTAMAEAAGDPYTAYAGPEIMRAAGEAGYIDGVGLLFEVQDAAGSRCRRVEGPCRTLVIAVSPDSPATRAGVAPGDVIKTVDGGPLEGMTPAELVEVFYGPPGTELSLEVDRGGASLELVIARTEAAEPLAYGELVGDTGYLRLPDFTLENAITLHYWMESLLGAGAERLVLDLRDNPGGLIASAVVVASEFLSGGLVVVTDGPEGETEYHVEEGGLAVSRVPLVVLVNEGSASASEILAGLLQERGRAVVMGTTTFGKGSVQVWVRLRNQGSLRVTVAGWTTPEGTDVTGVGVVPDVALDLPRSLQVGELVALALQASR